jgi:hypothetical protein
MAHLLRALHQNPRLNQKGGFEVGFEPKVFHAYSAAAKMYLRNRGGWPVRSTIYGPGDANGPRPALVPTPLWTRIHCGFIAAIYHESGHYSSESRVRNDAQQARTSRCYTSAPMRKRVSLWT